MQASDKTFRSLRCMHGLFWIAAMALLAATAWMILSDADRPWKAYQREFREKYSPKKAVGIRQIALLELTQELNFRRGGRCDRCPTCHLGIEGNLAPDPSLESRTERELSPPFAAHPRLDLFMGASSPHPFREYGCTVCHEGQGSATDFRWASHAPNDAASEKSWIEKYDWSSNPNWDFPMLPARFIESRCLQCHPSVTDLEPTDRFPDPPAPKLVAGYQLVRLLGCFGCHALRKGARDDGQRAWAGEMTRKVGPSLRQIAEKISAEHLADRISNPMHFLPESRMPRLFGLVEHLEEPALSETKRFEAVEIRAIASYLLNVSERANVLADTIASSSVERGKTLFMLQGCLACHKHQDFPQGQSIQGPDLSRMGAKYMAPNSRKWLVGWLRDPVSSSPLTMMPNPRLEKTDSAEDRNSSDPAEDLAAYLLESHGDFQASALPPLVEDDLDELMRQSRLSFSPEPTATALERLTPSLPLTVAVGSGLNENVQKKLQYLGRISIAKRGCFGCHDIPEFEKTSGIGPVLSDWGRKPIAQLAFEKIDEFVRKETKTDPFYTAALFDHRREGFLWQKLRAPRSFDYRIASKKNFNELLRMGRFNLTDAERETIATFVLGLTDDPPAGKYAYKPDAARKATVEGRKSIDRYACAECHVMKMERWTIAYKPGAFPVPPTWANFEFLKPQFSQKESAASKTADTRGFAQTELSGAPRLDSVGKVLEDEDEEGRAINYFTLWKPAVVDGNLWAVGGPDIVVPLPQIVKKRPPWGGTLAQLLYPVVLQDAKRRNSAAPETEARGWLPPPLVEEGAKVQPPWLHDYLLNPTTIRPAAILPMPKFNLSEQEATALVDYFAAAAKSSTENHAPRSAMANCQDRAMRLVLDSKNFCTKCHLLGDYRPIGEGHTILAPNLAEVGRRLQPHYLHRWLADPKSVLPYTSMPQNFPPRGEPRGQNLLPGTSIEQLDAVEALLLQYEEYAKRQMSIRKLMQDNNQ